MNNAPVNLARLKRQAAATTIRLRVNDALSSGARWLPFPLLYAIAGLTLIKVFRLDGRTQLGLVLGGCLPILIWIVLVLHAALRRRPWYSGSLALDRHHRLDDRITNALAFARIEEGKRTPFMNAAIGDALNVARDVAPRRAAPLRWPRELAVSLGLAVAVYGISLLEVRKTRIIPPPTNDFVPLVMSPDDLELFREATEQMVEQSNDPTVKTAVNRFNQLVEDIAERRLDRREVFRRLEELERSLSLASETDAAALDDALSELANELQKSGDTKPVAEALAEKNLKDAEEALRKLAERLKEKKPVDKQRLEQLRKALEQASHANTKRAERVDAERGELQQERQRLLKKKQEKGLSKDEQKRLEQLDRRLERLDRQKKRAESAKRQMSKLDRDLARAAQSLMKELGESAKQLEKAAEDLNETSQKQMTRKEKEELKRRLEELRQLLRQQGQGGKERLQRLLRFGQRARGGQPMPGGRSGNGKDQKPGQGQGRGTSKDRQLVLQRGSTHGQGIDIEMPGQGSPAPRPGGQSDSEGSGAGQSGSEWGTGHDPNIKGDKSDLKGQTQDVAAAGADTGQGPSTSEVIYSAAERGFASRDYQKVFTDYETVAEEVLKHDEVPPGFEFYVRRYFQLIRPRE